MQFDHAHLVLLKDTSIDIAGFPALIATLDPATLRGLELLLGITIGLPKGTLVQRGKVAVELAQLWALAHLECHALSVVTRKRRPLRR
ncbi:hypothetical protein D3C84_1018660 [compost metagenome]